MGIGVGGEGRGERGDGREERGCKFMYPTSEIVFCICIAVMKV